MASSVRQTEGRCRFLFGQRFYGNHVCILERAWGAKLHALRVAIAEVAVVSHTLLRRETHHAKGASEETHLAPNAAAIDDLDLAVGLTLDRHGRAHRRAWRIGTMHTHHRLIELLLVEIGNSDA